jgi:hypothetical protein
MKQVTIDLAGPFEDIIANLRSVPRLTILTTGETTRSTS